MSMTRALIIRTLLLTAMLVLLSGHTHPGAITLDTQRFLTTKQAW